MRSDTKSLLNRLGQPDFSYREYDDSPATSTERWPLFEVISRQLHLGQTLAHSNLKPDLNGDSEAEAIGNDIQSLVARIAKARIA